MGGLYTCYAAYFSHSLNIASFETLPPYLAQELYGWGPCLHPEACSFDVKQTYVNLLLSGGGLLFLFGAIVMGTNLGKYSSGKEIEAMALALVGIVATNCALVDFGGSLPALRFVMSYLLAFLFSSVMPAL